ncbi:hypothetical protein L1785_06610 [Antribacter sp. KLBMP9083]|uniref:Uncharacterized protein n=1 Tax=Antribacter soli TaxID=2910976 RepID=A0AA41UB03_9MICO|nr:hypothetical protein [Antribacter soli]MCF4120644.1 hypothetical protein [Antribacter soli]
MLTRNPLATVVAHLAVVAAVVLGVAGPTAALAPSSAGTTVVSGPTAEVRGDASTADPGTDDYGAPVVVVGVGGLRWPDVSRSRTPVLWRMIGSGSVGSLNVRTAAAVTCPVDAWLTLSAGRRVASAATDAECTLAPEVLAAGDQVPGTAVVAGWSSFVQQPDPAGPATTTDPAAGSPGTLGDLLAAAGECGTSVGPGAGVALAGSDGAVGRYLPSLDGLDDAEATAALTACPVTVIDAGVLPLGQVRHAALDTVNEMLRRLVRILPEGTRVVVAGTAGDPVAQQGLQVAVDWTSGDAEQRWLSSQGTRRTGFVQLVDVTATLADAAGALAGTGTEAEPEQRPTVLDGHPLERGEERRTSVARTVENRQYVNVLSQSIPALLPALIGSLVLLLAAAVAGALWTRRPGGHEASPAARRLFLATCLLVASAPVATCLATLSRWWVWPAPTFVLTASVSLGAVAVAGVTWWLSRLLPASPWRVATASAAVTWLVLTVDGLTGTTLQQGSLLGPSPALGARFYGFTNMTFAVYATAGLVLAGGLASLVRRRRLAVTVVASIGVVSVLVDGGPAFGADLGGILALVPAFAVLGLRVGRVRVTVRSVIAVVGATVAVVAAIAVADWLAPGTSSHLGTFVQRALEGDALGVIAGKAAGAWATVANPLGALATLAAAAAAWAALDPVRFRLPRIERGYRERPLLRDVVVALVVVAGVGSGVNDSGVVVAAVVLLLAVALLSLHVAVPVPRPAGDSPVRPAPRPGNLPGTVAALGGGLLVALLLASSILPAASGTGVAGEESRALGADAEPVAAAGAPLVVIGTAGLRWDDVRPSTLTGTSAAPTLAGLLTDGADAAGVTMPTGAAARCPEGGWLTLSAGRLAEVTDERVGDGWSCPDLAVTPAAGTVDATAPASVDGWGDLVALQRGSGFAARLGTLGTALASSGGCATAVGPGAAVAIATADGTVGRYFDLDAAVAPGSGAFDCPVTVVDAGSAADGAAGTPDGAAGSVREDAVAAVDATVRRVLDVVPDRTTILLVDLANVPGEPLDLGVTLVRPPSTEEGQPRYLTSTATRTEGVVRVQDVPATVLAAAGAELPTEVDDTPLVHGAVRPADVMTTADELADLTARDHVRRQAYVWLVDAPFYAGLALATACLLAVRVARRRGRTPSGRAGRVAEISALSLAALSAGGFLSSLTDWWRFPAAGWALLGTIALLTACVAGLGALAPRSPIWAGPGLVAGVTFGVLTLDALIGTPLNRAAPLGSAPTYGARFYGFGNPTFSVYAVAAVVLAAAVAQWLVVRGRRGLAAGAVAAIAVVALAVDVWPTLGADLGGGLVLVPAFVVVGLAASGLRLTLGRFLAVALAGVGLVAAVGVLDWLRPPEQRSHLGRFVGQVADGEAWATLARKAGYAARSVLGGVPVWITVLILVLVAVALFAPPAVRSRVTPGWFARAEASWPLLRPAVLALWVLSALGSVVNDFGVRIAMIALVPAVPLLTLTALRAASAGTDGPGRTPADPADAEGDVVHRGERPASGSDALTGSRG